MTQSNIHKEKYRRIHQLRRLTKQRRKTQICRTFETKIDMSKLSIKQKMCIRMCFIEAKWLYNDILNYSIENNIFDYKIDKTVKHYNCKNYRCNKPGNIVTKIGTKPGKVPFSNQIP